MTPPPTLDFRQVLLERGLAYSKIPKTGSESFERILEQSMEGVYGPEHLRVSNHYCVQAWPHLHIRPRVEASSIWINGGRVFEEQFEHLANDGRRVHATYGHWPWRFDPDIYSRIMVSNDPLTLAMLRAPEARAISTYYYMLFRGPSTTDPQSRDLDALKDANVAGFEEFLDSYDGHDYARWFGWPSPAENPSMEAARENLTSRIHFVGVVEQFDRFLALCHRGFGLRKTSTHLNRTDDRLKKQGLPPKLRVRDLPDSVLKTLREKTSRDRELYEVARSRLEADCEKYGVALLQDRPG